MRQIKDLIQLFVYVTVAMLTSFEVIVATVLTITLIAAGFYYSNTNRVVSKDTTTPYIKERIIHCKDGICTEDIYETH